MVIAQERYAIVGGGVLGMSLAARAAGTGASVTIFERAASLGGLAAPWQLGSITWDRHYHVILGQDRELLELLRSLESESSLCWRPARTGFFVDDSLESLSSISDFCKFPALSMVDKARLAATILYASHTRDWRTLEAQSAEDWLRKWCGSRTFEKLWRPLLRAKLGERYPQASAAFIWAIIARMYGARAAENRQEQFGYVRGGYATILAAFERHLSRRGVAIRTATAVQSVLSDGHGGFRLALAGGVSGSFDRVILTLPAPICSKLAPMLTAAERANLESTTYQGVICASMLLDRPLSPYYITNIADESVGISAIIDMSALVESQDLRGHGLVYLPKYVASGDPLFRSSDEEIRTTFVAAARRVYPELADRNILGFGISRVPFVFPMPTLEYSKHMQPVETTIPGLYVANSAQIVNGTLNVNETLLAAKRAMESIAAAPAPPRLLDAAVC